MPAETIMIHVVSIDQYGAKIRSMEDDKPKGCPGLGGWKQEDGIWTTTVKGADAKRFINFKDQYPDLTLEGDSIVSVE